ncbi:zinc-ribbon domain-containing protein [Levilactobacillus brevis]|uniref:zinc-ribbon domain-containing protein n=1 Tax=Levilactobacillus brevis TaxID=1580 RepID=UPI000A208949|nr:zinc ribbon domain-containing protein [Levilactobacillus brevis]ARN89368.1 hypothetical protein AZI09_01745 [Levilactobacillus brevis]ARN96944.1 hypothetical protein AZI10_01720 [Levilactobacillus brevis]
MKFCPNCGHQLEEGAKFCPVCGAQLTTGSDRVSEKAPVEQPKLAAEPTVSGNTNTRENHYEEHHESKNSTVDQPQLGFVGSIQYMMQHVFEFNGDVPESRKSVFWWGFLGVTLLNFVFVAIPYLGTILCWATQLLLVAAVMRRLAYLKQNVGLGWLFMVPVVSLYPLFLMFIDRKD